MFDFLSSGDEGGREETLELGEFREWFLDEVKDLENFRWSDVGNGYKEIGSTLEELQKNLKRLEESNVPEDVAPRLKKAGRSNKEALVKRLQGFVGSFEVPEQKDFPTAANFLDRKSKELQSLRGKVQRNFMFLQKVKEDETRALLDSMKDLESDLEKDQGLVETIEILETFSGISELINEKDEVEDEIAKLEENLRKERGDLDRLEENLEKIKKSESIEELKDKEEELKKARKEREKLKNKFLQKISPVKRGLKKLRYFGSVEENGGDLLERYITSPFKGAKEDEGLSFLKRTLKELERALENHELDFSPKERKKLKRDLNKIRVHKLRNLSEEWGKLGESIERLETEVEELKKDERKGKIESDTERKTDEIKELEKRIDSKAKKVEKIESEIQVQRGDLEEKVWEFLGVDLSLEGA